MDFEGLRRRSDEQYCMDTDGIIEDSAKRMNCDFMAFFERTDNGNNGGGSVGSVVEAGRGIESPDSEKLSGIIKSLEEEIGVKKSKDGDHITEADHDLLECLGIADRPHSYAENAYYKENHGEGHEFNFMDSVEEMNMGLSYQYPFMDEDSIPIYSGAVEVDNYYSCIPSSMTAAEGYVDGGEFFDESLWESTGS